MAKLLLAGHFGCGNLGDDAIFMGLIFGLGDANYEFTILSGNPEETFRNYGIRSVNRMDFGVVEQELAKCDALVFPGGSVFQDVTSVRSVAYYSRIVKMAKKAGKKVIMVGQGVGPLTRFFGKRMAAAAFNMADKIVVRDPMSVSALREMGVTKPMAVGADSAFLLPEPHGIEEASGFAVGTMRTIGIAPRPFGKDKKKAIQVFGDLARLVFQANMVPVLIEMDKNHDGPLILEISKAQGGKIPDLRKLPNPMQLQGRMARMDAVIAMRLHAGILATTVGVPAMMINYDPKVAAFAKMLDFGSSIGVENITAQRIFDSFQTFLKEKERNLRTLERKREEFRKLAQLNVTAIDESLNVKASAK